MGWTKLGIYAKPAKVDYDVFLQRKSQPGTVQNTLQTDLEYPFCAQDLDKDRLPSIPPEVVKQHSRKAENRLWIVIDEIVYDCSDFISEHPGGEAVIRNLSGSDCSWQFWRLHSAKHLRVYGLGLRVGRTHGVDNHFEEPKKYVGLRTVDDAFS